LKKLIGSVVATLVAATMMVFGLVAPASAASSAGNGFHVETTAGAINGSGTLGLVPDLVIPDPIPLKVVLSSGKFSNGSGTTTLTLQGTTTVQDTYKCVGIGSTVSVLDANGAAYTTVPVNVNGSSTTPCGGGAAAPPDPIVHQSASIALVAGGTPVITFNSAGSNVPTDYQVLINGATDYPKVTVAADGSFKLTLPKQLPGTTVDVRVYGDGSGSGALLAHVVVPEAPVVTPPADNTNTVKIVACHATGSATNPYVRIDTSVNAFIQAGHGDHSDDIVPPGTEYVKQGVAGSIPAQNWDANGQAIFNNGCAPVAPQPPADNTNDHKIEFCHATGSATNPYVKLNTSVAAFIQAGHGNHDDDIVPPGTEYVKQGVAGSIPAQNWDANGQAIFNNGCELVATHEPPVEDHPTHVNVCAWVNGDYKADVMSAKDIINQVGENFGKFIIPRFVYTDDEGKWQQYDGQNWSTDNRVILGNGCKVDKPAPVPSDQPKPGDKPAPTPTDSDKPVSTPTKSDTPAPTQTQTVTGTQVVTNTSPADTEVAAANEDRGFTASTAAHEEASVSGPNLWLLAAGAVALMAVWLLVGAFAPRGNKR
jgi:hypothetical protein